MGSPTDRRATLRERRRCLGILEAHEGDIGRIYPRIVSLIESGASMAQLARDQEILHVSRGARKKRVASKKKS